MLVYGELGSAQIELVSGVPANKPVGRLCYDTTSNLAFLTDGTLWKGFAAFDAVVGSGGSHADLATAVADANLGTNKRILVVSSEALTATVVLSKAGWHVLFAPGVTFSKSSATTGIQVTAAGVILERGRFTGFSTSGDKAVQYDSGGDYGHVIFSRFYNCDTEIDDTNVTAGKKPMAIGNHTEI